MTIKKISNFVFPTGSKTLSQDAYYKALSEAGSGFYPFGENSLWHGGIHIDKNVLNKIGNDDLLRCMANGEVIAYRVNDVYPKIIYEDNNEVEAPVEEFQKVAYFSTGFTLVRHYLKMPEISASTETPPAITLYSLYMHQLDWYGYEQKKNKTVDDKINYPHYWQVQSGKVNEEKAGAIYGSVIRENGKDSKVVGLLLKGSKVRLGEQKKGKSGWYKITSITQGILVTKNEYKNELGSTSGYVWKGDIGTSDTDRPTGNKAEADKDYEICLEDNYKVDSPEKEVKGIAVYEAANDTQKLTYLPITATFEFDGQENGYAKIRKIEGCSIPPALVAENGGADAPHKGYVNIESLTSTALKPEKFNEVIVLKQPIAIKKGDFIGYLGNNVSQSQNFDEPKVAALATMKRPSDEKLPKLAHIELFTCDDLPAFIQKTKALANNLPEYEKTIILVEKDAQLIQATQPTGFLHKGLGIEFISLTNSYYVKIKPVYTLNLSITPSLDTKTGEIIKGDGKKYYLTQEDKKNLLERYKQEYPQLIKSDIPDEVEIVNDIIASSTVLNKDMKTSITIRFSPENVYYWIASKDVFHLKGLDGQLNSTINYWNDFPLSLDGLPEPKQYNTVYFERTISLNSQSDESFIAVNDDDPDTIWRYIQAGNKEGIPIQGWVNTKNGVQEHIKLVTPWHWSGFNTVEEKSKVGQLSAKIVKNKMAKLDLEDYSPAMKELHQILVGTLRYSTQRKKTPPSFTEDYLKEGLRRSWTAERIGHLLVKYESEWYADEALTKWNEIDELFEEEKDEKKEFMSKLLDGLGIDKEYLRKFAFDKVDEELEYIKRVWQIEKKKRIKPSLWWKDVADKQASQSTNTNNDAPTLTNLSKDGKAWFIHPVAMVDYFVGNVVFFRKGDKDEIIREINIRLAGFGGNVPTDEFTERTENMIKQFQRDYMKVEETGVVDMQVIEAIDKFQEEYPIETYFAQAKCKCSTYDLKKVEIKACGGFGLERYSEQKQKEDPVEKKRKYEYPGLHRTLFWVLRAWKFYLKHFDQRNMKIEKVESGYRCWRDNKFHKDRQTTNHMGKALDIHMVYNNPKITTANLCDDAREVMIEYCDAQYRWDTPNFVSLEPGNRVKKSGELAVAPTWIHFDVRSFQLVYLKDEYFAKSVEQVNGISMQTLITNKG